MSEEEVKEFMVFAKKYTKKLARDKKASHEFLVAVGIITKKGNLRKNYKNLPALLGQR
jgi:hypothetical protein